MEISKDYSNIPIIFDIYVDSDDNPMKKTISLELTKANYKSFRDDLVETLNWLSKIIGDLKDIKIDDKTG